MRCGPHFSFVARVLPLLLVASCGSCRDRQLPEVVPEDAAIRYAKAMCDAHARCDCMGEVFPDAAACNEAAVQLFEVVAATPNLAFHEACFERLLDTLDTGACDSQDLPAYTTCQIFTGTLSAGEPCTPEVQLILDWSPELHTIGSLATTQCAGENGCVDGRCGPLVEDIPVGAACSLASGHGCVRADAATPAGCGIDGRCQPRAASNGADCWYPLGCPYGSYCAGLDLDARSEPGECRPYVEIGVPCERDSLGACAHVGYCSTEGVCAMPWPELCGALVRGPGQRDDLDWQPVQ